MGVIVKRRHKDLKLANVMIDSSGCVKIIDFDISRLHRIAADRDTYSYGTIPYASPEHFGFGQTNEKSDQYAIGQMMRKMGLEYGRFAKIIRKTTEVDSEKRYKNVMELKRDLIGKHEGLFPIPGFRSGFVWKKVIAVLGYLLIFFTAFSVEAKNPRGAYEIWGNRLTVLAALLTEVDLFAKWTPVFRQIPLLDDSRAVVRAIAHIILGIIIFFVWVFIEVMEIAERIREVYRELDEKDKQIFSMSFVASPKMTISKIADELGMSRTTVSRRVKKIQEKILKRL